MCGKKGIATLRTHFVTAVTTDLYKNHKVHFHSLKTLIIIKTSNKCRHIGVPALPSWIPGSVTLAGRHDTRKLLLQVLVNSQGDL